MFFRKFFPNLFRFLPKFRPQSLIYHSLPTKFFHSKPKSESLSISSFLSLQDRIITEQIGCKGCGSQLQITDPTLLGYISPEVMNRKLSSMNQTQKPSYSQYPQTPMNNKLPDEILNEYRKNPKKIPIERIEIRDIDTLESLEKHEDNEIDILDNKIPNKNIICERCHGLKHGKLIDKTLISEENELKNLDLESFIEKIYKNIKPFSLILYLIDLSNLSATAIPRLLQLKKEKRCQIWVIINKIDVLPKDLSRMQTKGYLRKFLQDELGEFPQENLYFVSSLTGEGIEKITKRLKPPNEKIEKMFKKDKKYRRAYVIGCTNTGKSTFINRMLKELKPKNYRFYHDPYEKTPIIEELTTSPTPNTTLNVMEIEHAPLRYKLFDTPGIPNEIVLGGLMSRLLKENNGLVIKKRIKGEIMDFSPGKSILFGGLIRLDYPIKDVSSNMITLHIYCSYEVFIDFIRNFL